MTQNETTVAVLRERHVLREAYDMGYDRFEGSVPEDDPNPSERVSTFTPSERISMFTESATYTNSIKPKLRALSGYVDSGTGTYTVPRSVVVVPPESEDDRPMNGKNVDIAYACDRIVEAWRSGALDAIDADRDHGDGLDDLRL
jgi:hypothetical protein